MNTVTPLEIIRLCLFPLTGAVVMFVLQPILYQSQILRLTDVKPQLWVNTHYFPSALIVFGFTIFTALAWCALNTFSPPSGIKGIIPIASIAIAILLSRLGILAPKGSNDATISTICLFFLDVLWLYWLTTATSTPGVLAKSIPPGAGLFGR
jgi:uncharacterized oligopeptide transporter (OPT) family protein